MKRLKRICKWIFRDWWVVRPCGWPYREGFATFNSFRNTVLDTGLTKDHAQRLCDQMNRGAR